MMLDTREQCVIVIMGATGDLTKRKLIPAIYKLIADNKIGRCVLIGAAKDATSADEILENSKPFVGEINEKVWAKLRECFFALPLDFEDEAGYEKLSTLIADLEQKHGIEGNRLFYLATMPEFFAPITENLHKVGVVERCDDDEQCVAPSFSEKPWYRVVYEKPFGQDLESAKEINRRITQIFCEKQIFRVDHYLCNELVGNIAMIRFTNLFFEPLWSKEYIESVQVILKERIGISGRGNFYEKYGVFKDVVQNHVLQLVTLVAMEAPKKLSGDHIRDAKISSLKAAKVDDYLLGQYDGYLEETGVEKNSHVPTFAAAKISIDNDRWRGVPFFIKTGKALDERATGIHVKFKNPVCLLTKNCPEDSNYLSIDITPENSIFLEINIKVPGKKNEITPVKMEMCHNELFGPNTPQAYETLLHDVICGDQSAFVRFDEVEESWRVIDEALSQKKDLSTYQRLGQGPDELIDWSKKHGVRWRS